jgi:NodT family efflux transporter outer membrane factor (OMF) lipoprotein
MTRRASLMLALLLAGCASQEGLHTRATPIDATRLASERSLQGAPQAAAGWPAEGWWQELADPQLDRLIEAALTGSPSLRLARARVDRALALAEAAGAPRDIQVSLGVDATRQRLSQNGLIPPGFGGRWIWQNQAQLNFSYEFDFWGRNAAAYAAALGEVRAAQADAQAARLVLSAAIAHAYVQLARSYDQLALARDTLAQRERQLALVRERLAAGLDSRVELKQAEAALPEARQRIAQLEESIVVTRHQIAALLGEGPDGGLALEAPQLAARATPALPTVLPADLIGRRPDIVASRWRVEAAAQDIKNARAQFYPNVNLAAFAGLQSITWSKFPEASSRTLGVGPAVRLPLFDSARLRGDLGARNADYDVAVEQYNQTVADALREVADQLAILRSLERQDAEVAATLAAVREAYGLALLRYRSGLSNYLAVLSVEAQLTAARALAAELRDRRLDAGIDLVRTLGGGFLLKNEE